MRRRFFNNNIKNFDINDYLTIEALEDNLQVYFPYEDLMFGIDGIGWQKLVAGAYTPAISKGQTISFKGNVSSSMENIKSFTITKRCNLIGNCMSLTSNGIPNFYALFRNCTTIVYISKDFLPATTLAEGCYQYMFCGCYNLTQAPELPATTLASYCYADMFRECINLTTAPELPATTLGFYCYEYMFYDCSRLNYIKAMFTTKPSSSYTYNWVDGVASTGTFVKNKNATWNATGTYAIPSGWSVETASSLITFTIEGTEYLAEEGMTWEEFANSKYDTYNHFQIILSRIMYRGGDYVSINSIEVLSTDLIIENGAYTISPVSSD